MSAMATRVPAREVREPLADPAIDLGMDDRFEVGSGSAVAENEAAQGRPVEAAVRLDEAGAKSLHHAGQPFRARRDRLTGETIGVDDRGARERQTARGNTTFLSRCRRSEPRGASSHGNGAGGRGFQRVPEEDGDRQGTDAARNGRERPGDLRNLGMHIADDDCSAPLEIGAARASPRRTDRAPSRDRSRG